MPRPYRLLIFDWDGTLMDSAPRIVDSFHCAIADTDLPACTDQTISNVIGLGLWEAVKHMYPDAEDGQLRHLIERYRYHFRAVDTPMPLFEGVAALLQTLRQRGYLLGVATGKSRVGLDRMLNETGFGPLFQATRTSDETQSKPHPQMLNEIMATLDVKAENAIMVGDSEYDLAMAVNAGMASLAVSYGVHACDRLLAHHPLACLDDLRDLLEWLEA